jgi:molybdopterin-containing oxidoreductase family iron-sulfur binding subunit
MDQHSPIGDLPKIRQRIADHPGSAMWRSLDEAAGSDEFREALSREFPASLKDFVADGASRRRFLQLMGASMALAGLYGCSERPSEKIVPYVRQPDQIVPGMPIYFATAMPLNGFGYGVLAESHEGRPTKIEGNPDHPASLGAANLLMQASVLQLYDPDMRRLKDVNRAGVVSAWHVFTAELQHRLHPKRQSGGQGVRLLTGTVTSPTLGSQIQAFLKLFPKAQWHHYDPLARVNSQQGAMQTFGKPLSTVYHFGRNDDQEQPSNAKVIVSFDSDFLWADPGSLQYARHFAAARKVRVRHSLHTTMSRAYVIESTLSLTGAMADHRLPAKPEDVAEFASLLASRLGVGDASAGTVPAAWSKLLDAIVSDLKASKGESIVIVGESMPPEIHRLGHLMNAALGNVGKTVAHIDSIELLPTGADDKPVTAIDSLRQLTDDMNAGQVDLLLILDCNAAYTAPADIPFGDALLRMSEPQVGDSSHYKNFTAALAAYGDETARLCQWQLPLAHYLESWGDVRAFDGTASIIQPVILPIYQGRSSIGVMDGVLSPPNHSSAATEYEVVRAHWRQEAQGDFDAWWDTTLQKGVVAGSAFPPVNATSRAEPPTPTSRPAQTQPSQGLRLVFRPDPSVWDGAFSNNPWLQECPKFFTKLVWDNAALLSPKTAETLRANFPALADGQIVRFSTPDGHQVEAPVMVVPGLPEDCVTLHFGYGRTSAGANATESDGVTARGFNAFSVRTARSPWSTSGATMEPVGKFRQLVVTHNHAAMDTQPKFGPPGFRGNLKADVVEHPVEGQAEEAEQETNNRKLIRTTTLQYFNADPKHRHFVRELGSEGEKTTRLTIYPEWDYTKGYQWGMSIDLQSCIGCNACLVACVAENNIAVVGRDEVSREREMHWIRIDQYFADDLDNPKIYNQPVPCMHCENAPCELVCPVGATVHSSEGLNQMVYNRCIGTRYCSNNCPYKVRRFNFFYWYGGTPTELNLQRNPEVTVRTRGVMEKCTYCIQRIQRTRIEIEKMIVRADERIDQLTKQRATAPAEQFPALDRQIAELTKERHNGEFETLERLETACEQACPTRAITFGHLLPVKTIDEQGKEVVRLTQVKQLKEEPLDYPLLAELTTVPRTTYMARLRNPNPDLEPDART